MDREAESLGFSYLKRWVGGTFGYPSQSGQDRWPAYMREVIPCDWDADWHVPEATRIVDDSRVTACLQRTPQDS